jgi:putative DNA primase/helicase
MDYFNKMLDLGAGNSPRYLRNDIGTAQLFYDLHSDNVRFVKEAENWFTYDGCRWEKDIGGYVTAELCKAFVMAFNKFVAARCSDDTDFVKYAAKLSSHYRREGILSDVRSIAPLSMTDFDTHKTLLNLNNGTFDLDAIRLRPHQRKDFITQLAPVDYIKDAVCERWLLFIDEITCGDKEIARFLQKSLGYALSGSTKYECAFLLWGATSRNGKSTLAETVSHILGDYAKTTSPQTFSSRPADGAKATPDTARLKGARFVVIPEPDKGLELNAALLKQFTGGDTFVGRHLRESPFEYRPEFKPFINTNHLPIITDDTLFASNRIIIIPFERHFKPDEQDRTLKDLFRKPENMSGILNWLIDGHKMLQAEGLVLPVKLKRHVEEYRQETDDLSDFLLNALIAAEHAKTKTVDIYQSYAAWAKGHALRPVNNKGFVGELRKRYDVRRDNKLGNVVVGMGLR